MCSTDPNVPDTPAPEFVCSVDMTNGKPTGLLILSNDIDVSSARYQWRTPIQLWKKNSRYIASFNAFYVVNFNRDIEFTQRPLFSGGGLAFAITPDTSVVGTGQETFGLFPINEQTGASLRGAKTKTVAVEMDLSRIDDKVGLAFPNDMQRNDPNLTSLEALSQCCTFASTTCVGGLWLCQRFVKTINEFSKFQSTAVWYVRTP